MAEEPTDSLKQLSRRIEKGKELLKRCDNLEKSIEGVPKLKKKILAELKFLKSLERVSGPLKTTHIKSTNLSFLEGVLLAAEQERAVTAVFKSFCYVGEESTAMKYVVDVVAESGCCWIKVTARNVSALHRTWQGQGDFDDKDIVQRTKELQEVSKQHPLFFTPPVVMLSCCNGISQSLAKALANADVFVKGEIVPDPGSEVPSSHVIETAVHNRPHYKECNCINLDITTMIALVSSLTNGSCGYVFEEAILTEQAWQEKQNPVMPKLMEFLEGKDLFACQSAVRDFNDILKTVGGNRECERARVLLDKITIVEDNPSARSNSLQLSASIKERSKLIFGTGDSLKAITTTANVAFTRAAASQGIEFSVFIHASRALSEAKEPQASCVYETLQDMT